MNNFPTTVARTAMYIFFAEIMSVISSIFILILPVFFLIIAFYRIVRNKSFKIEYIHLKKVLLSVCFGLFLRCISEIVYNGGLIYYGWATINFCSRE